MPTNADLIQLEDDRPLQDFVPVNCVSNNKKVSTATSIWTGWARRPSTTASSVQGDEDDFFGCGLDEDNRTFFCSPPPPPEELRPRGSQGVYPMDSSSIYHLRVGFEFRGTA
eukprot:Protomagalhaensia_wolfi_Nauph_80__5652@NODE_656_length_2158_cov_140_401133_g486_i1_p3_GENE_NODE_656_length_2158_cov_140_401133_g486_i1NODE_656_length_2158_cov_140_401133_g486_i1_p3_ORF_typecomplete_len112_score17_44CholecysARec_N/PF09193_10/0_11_NODE_656_length_2158_cov_140_401133_g486_i117632098